MEYLIFLLIEVGAFIVFCRFRLFKWACFAYSLLLAFNSLVVGLILMYANPRLGPGMPVSGQPVVPMLVALLFVFTAFLALLPSRRQIPILPEKVSAARWAIWAGGVLLPILGLGVFLLAVYSPASMGGGRPMAAMGSWAVSLATAAGVVLLYFASRLNTAAAPNRMRWWALGVTALVLSDKLLLPCAMILIYVAPPQNADYASEVSWLSLGMAPLALLLMALARQRVD